MQTQEMQDQNEQFYKRLIANLYYANYQNYSSDVFRGKDLKEALSVASNFTNLIGVNKLEIGDNQIHDLYKAIGAIEMMIVFEDQTNLHASIIHSNDYQFTIEQHLEDYIRQLNAMDLLVEKLKEIQEMWHLRKQAVELFRDEYKELRKDELEEVKS